MNTIGLVIRGMGIAIMSIGVLPKVWKESRVPNGLGFLRRIIFFGHTVYFSTQLISLIVNFFRSGGVDIKADVLSLLNSVSFLIISMVLYLIYHLDYGRVKK